MSQLGLGMSTVEQPPTRRRRRWIGALVAIIVVLALLVGLVVVATRLLDLGSDADYPGPGTGEVSVEIPKGASLTDMANVLVAADVVKSTSAFLNAAEANDDATHIQPGTYRLRTQMRAADAVAALLNPAYRVIEKVTVPEGLRVSQTVDVLARKSHLTKGQLRAALKKPKRLGLPDYAGTNPEGFLFPATYELQPATTAMGQLQAMVRRFDQASATVDLEQRASDVGLTPYEVVIVASLLQSEGRPKDFPKVARVIYNRLDQGMPLQLDATVNYALGQTSLTLTPDDLKVDSPYNTYLHTGLPPGPINSPGEDALEAALSPADGPWLYYVTVNPDTGKTKFTDSYEEFLEFKAELKANQ